MSHVVCDECGSIMPDDSRGTGPRREHQASCSLYVEAGWPATSSEVDAYHTGAEDGFWRGYLVGADALRRYIAGEVATSPSDVRPTEFGPLGPRWYDHDFSEGLDR